MSDTEPTPISQFPESTQKLLDRLNTPSGGHTDPEGRLIQTAANIGMEISDKLTAVELHAEVLNRTGSESVVNSFLKEAVKKLLENEEYRKVEEFKPEEKIGTLMEKNPKLSPLIEELLPEYKRKQV